MPLVVLHRYEICGPLDEPLPLSVTVGVTHEMVPGGAMITVGGFMAPVTVTEAVFVQLLLSVTVTVYVPFEDTTIGLPDSLVDHAYIKPGVPPLAVAVNATSGLAHDKIPSAVALALSWVGWDMVVEAVVVPLPWAPVTVTV